jgi:hypothetical protein
MKLHKRLVRKYGKLEYIMTVEQHRDGYPHINLLLLNPNVYAVCRGDGWKRWRNGRGWLGRNAVECGFGLRVWAEPLRNEGADKLAGYVIALANESCKLCQLPVNAPKRFRRIRASQKLMPAKVKDPTVTGGLIKKPIDVVRKECNEVRAFRKRVLLLILCLRGGGDDCCVEGYCCLTPEDYWSFMSRSSNTVLGDDDAEFD